MFPAAGTMYPWSAAFDDARWDDANLPHSFSMPYFAADRFYVGYGWYRKHFQLSPEWAAKRVNLEFDGAFQVAELFVNGRRVGEHQGGYTGFTFDITDAVKPGDNVVAVRVNNHWNARLAPARASTLSPAASIATCGWSSPRRCTSPGTARSSRRRRSRSSPPR